MWSIQSLRVASRYNIPVTFIVLANAAYRQVRLMKCKIPGEQVKGRNPGTELRPPQNDSGKLAEGMGLTAQKATQPGELKPVWEKAFTMNRANLVEMAVDPAF